jgi:O-antigen ligase
MYAADYATACQTTFALTLLTGITLGKMARLFLSRSYQYHVVLCFVVLLAATSWCHLDMTNGFYPSYHGPRWMGLWNNPNTYGMLMGAGFILSICLLVEQCRPLLLFAYCLAAGLTGLGLLFSCSRGAWCGVVFAVLYMGTVRWKELYYWIVPIGLFAILAAVLFFWNFQTDRWYLKRLDLNRPSCQNRIAAWKGAVQIIRDHPWRGVGWNMTGRVYENHYSPPADGGAAIVTNDYLMLGTELGLPGLLCFMAYVGLALKGESRKQKAETLEQVGIRNSEFGIKTACRAGALVLLVSFWFNSGLFNLPTAMVSWVLLELGAVKSAQARVAGSGSG